MMLTNQSLEPGGRFRSAFKVDISGPAWLR